MQSSFMEKIEKVINGLGISYTDARMEDAVDSIEELFGGEMKPDEVTMAFFQKYLKMPDANLEELCLECKRLVALDEAIDSVTDSIIKNNSNIPPSS